MEIKRTKAALTFGVKFMSMFTFSAITLTAVICFWSVVLYPTPQVAYSQGYEEKGTCDCVYLYAQLAEASEGERIARLNREYLLAENTRLQNEVTVLTGAAKINQDKIDAFRIENANLREEVQRLTGLLESCANKAPGKVYKKFIPSARAERSR